MADFDLGYYYYLHDKIEDEKEKQAGGNSMVSLGTFFIILSVFLFIIFRASELFLLAVLGAVLIAYGLYKNSGYLKAAHSVPGQSKGIDVEIHHNEGYNLLARTSILRNKLASPFSEELSAQLREKNIITSVIKQNSGSDINSIYQSYRQQGGAYGPEHFIKTLHILKKHGIVRVRKSISQTSRIPDSST
ncbi:hypothetical protein HYY72_04975 [Candidatus Woesearchaeota archaeon]|nr:hypothetical protein [Candidatus Woesearchaeota archaeon]